MITPQQRYSKEKYEWRLAVIRLGRELDEVSNTHNHGKQISMVKLRELSNAIVRLGEQGINLRSRLRSYGLANVERQHQSIAATCKLIEDFSRVVEKIVEYQDLPMHDLLTFRSELAGHSEVETGALEAFEELRRIEDE